MRRHFAHFLLLTLTLQAQEVLLPPPLTGDLPLLPESPPTVASPLAANSPVFSMPENIKLTGRSFRIEKHGEFYKAIFPKPVKLTGNNGLEIFANRGQLDEKTKTVTLSGNVRVYQNGLLAEYDRATYFYEEERLQTRGLRTSMDPILLESGKFRAEKRNGKTIFIGDHSGITTHDVEKPNFWLRADRTTIYPDDKVVFKDMKLYLGKTPIFWLPYLSQPLDQNLGYHFVPGGRSNLGFFLKNRYGVMLGGERDPVTGANDSAWLLAQWRADLYSRRGVGLGVDLLDTRVDPNDDFGWLKFYHIYDFDPSVERSGIPRNNERNNRYRIDLAQRINLGESEHAQYQLQGNLSLLSDRFFLEDFEQRLFRSDPAPDNTFAFRRRTANSLTTLGGRVRLNDFYDSDTRLPELTFDWVRQPFLGSKFLYESQSSFGLYDESLSRFNRDGLESEAASLLPGDPRLDEIDRLLDDRGFARLHTYHEFSRPTRWGHLKLVPRLGGGYTSYHSVEGAGNDTDRGHLFAGIDASVKFTKQYHDLTHEKWGLNDALHIVQPYANLSWLATNDLDPSFGRIDRLAPSTRPRPLDVGRFSAIDDFADWSILRLGVRNRLVTRRDGGTHDWLSLDTYFDVFFDDPEFSRKVSNLYNDLIWRPLPWLELELETQFPLFSDSNFTEIAASSKFLLNPNLEVDLGYRFLKNHPILIDSNRLELEAFYRLNERWGFGFYNRWEFEDSTLELQQYNIHYDFDSWVASVGFFHRDNRRRDEFGISLNFGLKDFPSLALPIKVGAE